MLSSHTHSHTHTQSHTLTHTLASKCNKIIWLCPQKKDENLGLPLEAQHNAQRQAAQQCSSAAGPVLGRGAWLFTVIIISFIRVVKATTRLDYTPQHRHSTDDCIALCCGQVREGCGAGGNPGEHCQPTTPHSLSPSLQ